MDFFIHVIFSFDLHESIQFTVFAAMNNSYEIGKKYLVVDSLFIFKQFGFIFVLHLLFFFSETIIIGFFKFIFEFRIFLYLNFFSG